MSIPPSSALLHALGPAAVRAPSAARAPLPQAPAAPPAAAPAQAPPTRHAALDAAGHRIVPRGSVLDVLA